MTSAAQTDGRASRIEERVAFSTLACPDWTLEEAAGRGRDLGFGGLELRLLDGEVVEPDLDHGQRRRIRASLRDAGMAIVALDTSFFLAEHSVEDLIAYVGIASDIGAPVVRIFGGSDPSPQALSAMAKVAEGAAQECQELGVTLALETHDHLASARQLVELLRLVGSPRFAVLWDVHNTHTVGESPATVWELVGPNIVATHVKDGLRGADGRSKPVPMGTGDVPVAECLRILKANGYEGWISLEWEKKWHPEIAPPEIALPHELAQTRLWLDSPASPS